MGRFEASDAGLVIDVRPWCDSDPPHLGSESIGDVVAVEVGTGDDVVLGGPGQNLLEEGIADDILDEDLAR